MNGLPDRAGRIEGYFTMVETRGQRAGGPHVPEGITTIGRGVVVEGAVKGGEDLVIEGEVNGTIELTQHVLTVGPTGRVKASRLSAKSVVVLGKVHGSIQASELVRIGETGSVEGAIAASRLVVADGAHLHGRVDV